MKIDKRCVEYACEVCGVARGARCRRQCDCDGCVEMARDLLALITKACGLSERFDAFTERPS